MAAEWLGSIVIGKLQDTIRSYIDQQFEYQTGVKSNLEKLDRSLTKIQAAVAAAEKREIQEEGLQKWLNRLKDVVRDAEDVLDLFDYQLLEDEAQGKSSTLMVVEEESKRNNLVSSFFNLCNCYKIKKETRTVVKRLFFMDEDLNDLIAVVNEFDDLVSGMGDFLKLVELESTHNNDKAEAESLPDWRRTTHFPLETKVIGRRDETQKLLDYLLVSGTSEPGYNRNYSIASVVGIGGMGKTTIAQSIYNDPKVQDHFDVKAWVCVSDRFSVLRITVDIIVSSSIGRQTELTGVTNLGSIQEMLKGGLKGKKFLIVLDDVWNEVMGNWDSLSVPFRYAGKGSKVLVTTRSRKVADIMGSMETLYLRSLEVADYWELFRQYAFGDANLIHLQRLELIGREIAKKLGGLPLAAKTVGRALHYDMTERHWNEIWKSKLCEIEQEENGITPALRLSYNHLPKHLKQCFLFCSLFPKDYQYDRDRLIKLWIASDYVKPRNSNITLEDEGRKHFEELVSRSFIEKAQSSDRYVIHDLLHDLAESISGDEICRVEDDEEEVKIPERVRHLYVDCKNLDKILDQISGSKRLRTLIVAREAPSRLERLKGLRILMLQGVYYGGNLALPEEINLLKHLRYLEFHFAARFPESLGKLYHLQVLRCTCLSVQWQTRVLPTIPLPKGMNKLKKLRFINVDGHWVARIPNIGQLTELQELEKFKVAKEEGWHIKELKNLRQIRGFLYIHGLVNIEVAAEAKEAELHKKEHLEGLELSWSTFPFDRPSGEKDMNETAEHDEEVLDSLRPHRDLRSIDIHDYWGTKCAAWLGSKTWPSNLETIRLSNCKFLALLPPLGQLPFLKVLTLGNLSSLEEVGPGFYGEDETAFPSLEKLVLSWMPELTKWSPVDNGQRILFPRLSNIEIWKCPKMRGPIPFRPSPSPGSLSAGASSAAPESDCVLNLLIDGCLSVLVGILDENALGNLQSLVFKNIESFTNEQDEWLRKITSLKDLSFRGSSEMLALPAALIHLSSLKKLTVQDCDEVQSLTELPASLEELHIIYSEKLKQRYDRSEGGGGWLEISHVPKVIFN